MPEIVSVRLQQAEDAEHEHVALLGYHSTHLKTEPVMIAPGRVRENEVLGEKYWVTVDGQRVDLAFGACRVCGVPTVGTAADSGETEYLKHLPQS